MYRKGSKVFKKVSSFSTVILMNSTKCRTLVCLYVCQITGVVNGCGDYHMMAESFNC